MIEDVVYMRRSRQVYWTKLLLCCVMVNYEASWFLYHSCQWPEDMGFVFCIAWIDTSFSALATTIRVHMTPRWGGSCLSYDQHFGCLAWIGLYGEASAITCMVVVMRHWINWYIEHGEGSTSIDEWIIPNKRTWARHQRSYFPAVVSKDKHHTAIISFKTVRYIPCHTC